jgi:hypothetical protein
VHRSGDGEPGNDPAREVTGGGEVNDDGVTQLVDWGDRAAVSPQGSGAGDMADLPPMWELFLPNR